MTGTHSIADPLLDPTLVEAVKVSTQIIIGIAGVVISWGVFRLTKQRMKDTWIRTYAEIHSAFWNDPIIQEVRCWLAYPNVNADLKSILLKRRDIDKAVRDKPSLTCEEYSKLDKLDKYLNILLRAVTLNPKISRKRDLWNALNFKYWLCACLDSHRPELKWYVQKFYSQLYEFGQTREMCEYCEKVGFKLEKREETRGCRCIRYLRGTKRS